MRRFVILFFIAGAVLFACVAVAAEGDVEEVEEFRPLKERKFSHFSATFRGGYFMPEDDTYRRFYGRWSNDIYFFEFGYYVLRNLSVLGSVGGYYQRNNTRGEITGEKSGEDLTWTNVYLEAGASYRLRFIENQLFAPFISAAYDYYYYHENADPGPVVDGWKNGPAAWGGLLILLDNAEPDAAANLKRRYGVEHTYMELSVRYHLIGESGGINMSGLTYMIGISFDF